MKCPWAVRGLYMHGLCTDCPTRDCLRTVRTGVPRSLNRSPTDCPWIFPALSKDRPCYVHRLLTDAPGTPHGYSNNHPRAVPGLSMFADCLRVVDGLPTDCPRTVHGRPTDSPRTAHGLDTDCTCNAQGLPTDCRRTIDELSTRCPWTVYGLSTNFLWTPHGQSTECPCAVYSLSTKESDNCIYSNM